MVATQIFFEFSPLLGEDEPILTNIFQIGWNHHLGVSFCFFWVEGMCQKDKDHTVSMKNWAGVLWHFRDFVLVSEWNVCFRYVLITPWSTWHSPPKVGKYRADINCMVNVPTTFTLVYFWVVVSFICFIFTRILGEMIQFDEHIFKWLGSTDSTTN